MRRYWLILLIVFPIFPPMVFPTEPEQDQEYEHLVFPPQAILNATYMGDIAMMKRILETNPNKDVRDAMGGTALHIAIFRSNFEAMMLLLDHGFDINAVADSTGFTPLHYSVWLNNANAARFLLLHNADRGIKDNNGLTPLEKATKESKRDMVLVLARR
jgi:ankyrin repeat protein